MFRPKLIDPATRTPEEQEQIRVMAQQEAARQERRDREGPFAMGINREIMGIVLQHLAVPTWPDGSCVNPACDESAADHGADHLINELVKAFDLPWVRRYDARWDGAWPPSYCEDAEAWRKAHHPEEFDVDHNPEEDQITDADVVEYPEEDAVVDQEDAEGDEELDDLVTPLVSVRMFDNVDDLLVALDEGGFLGDDEEEDGVPVSLTDLRVVALSTALELQPHTKKYATAQTLVEEAETILGFLTGDVIDA